MMPKRLRDAMPWLFSRRHSTTELEAKIQAVDAKADRIQAQINRMQNIFDKWTERHSEAQ